MATAGVRLEQGRHSRRRRWGVLAHRNGPFGLGLLAVAAVIAFAAPLVARWDPNEIGVAPELQAPTLAHPLGVDELGRDLLARIAVGLRVSIVVSLLSVSAGGLAGTALGLSAAYWGGRVDAIAGRAADVLLPYPPILVGIALTAALSPGTASVALAIAVVSVPLFLRVARAASLVEQSKDYIEAAHSLGASVARILVRHVLPNTLTPLLTQFAVSISYAIVLESGLSFLGIGVQPPHASLGSVLNTSRPYLEQAPWYAVFTGLSLAILLLGVNVLSDAIRETLDPRHLTKGA